MYLWIVILIVLSVVVTGPAFLLAGGKVLKVKDLNYKKVLRTNLLLFLFGAVLLVAALLLLPVIRGILLLNILFLLTNVAAGIWIIRKTLKATLPRSAGVYLVFALLSMILTLLVSSYVMRTAHLPVNAGSMKPGIMPGDFVIVNKLIYRFKDPSRGEPVAFKAPTPRPVIYVKRLIGLPGEVVEIRDGKIHIDQKPLEEHLQTGTPIPSHTKPRGERKMENYGPVTVPEHCYFVLGDDLDNSYDSRDWGFVAESKIVGRVDTVYWSVDSRTHRIRWDRIAKRLINLSELLQIPDNRESPLNHFFSPKQE